MKQVSYVMVKPGFANNPKVVEYIKAKLKECGLEIVEEAEVRYTRAYAQKHYAEHFRGSYENAKGFYRELEDYIVSDKAYGMKVVGENAILECKTNRGDALWDSNACKACAIIERMIPNRSNTISNSNISKPTATVERTITN